jgi:hypothetical protein
MYKVVFGYPWWMLVFSVAAGFFYAWFLYRKKNQLEIKNWLYYLLFSLRFVSVFTISLLLLNMLIKWENVDVQKPILVLAIDNSESMQLNNKEKIKQSISSIQKELSDNYDLKTYLFGEKISLNSVVNFQEKETDISELVDEVQNNYSGRNLGAVILLSDGIINRGENPSNNSFVQEVPFYSIAWGDTTVKKDLAINKVLNNKFAYLGNTFPIEITIEANEFKDRQTKVTLKEGENLIAEQQISFNKNSQLSNISFQVEAKSAGLKSYTLQVVPLEGEFTLNNNSREIFVEVIENKEKVLILSSAPHPDIAAIVNTIQGNEAYTCDYYRADEFNGKLDVYNLVVFFQIPSLLGTGNKFIQEALSKNIPCLFTIGSQTNFSVLNSLPISFSLNSQSQKPNEVFPSYNKAFSSFSLDDKIQKFINQVPPLYAPFGGYKTAVNANILFSQKIGSINSSNPLVFFQEVNSNKLGFICGEGLWKWRINDFIQNQNHEIFTNLVGKIVQYLASKESKKPFRIFGKNSYKENENIEMDAELFNAINELINEPDLIIEITNENGKKYPFTFNKNFKNYHLDAGLLPPGNYSYSSKVNLGNKTYSESGRFRIEKLFSEVLNSVANHNLLQTLALKSSGKMFYPGQEKEMIELIKKREEIKPMSFTNKQFKDAINIKWIFFFILILLSAEWFLRKRNGYY